MLVFRCYFCFFISFIFLPAEKNSSPTLARNKANIEYISGGQPSPYELAFGVELGPDSHFIMVLESILNPLNGPPTMLSTHQAQ